MKMNWVIYSIIATISFTFMVLAVKKLSNLGVGSKLFNLYLFGLVFIGFLVWNISTNSSLKINKTIFIFLLIAAIFSLIGNFLMVYSIGLAPNPGYIVAIVGTHGALVTLLAFFIFRSEITFMKIVGVVLAAIGVILISI